jgi:heptosyltransferase-2
MMQEYSSRNESVTSFPWKSDKQPGRVLIIRMHAIGDVAITLPAVLGFLKQFPDTRVDFLTTRTVVSLFDSLPLRGNMLAFPDHLDRWGRLRWGLRFGQTLRNKKYDVVIDLQRNWVSRLVRRMISPGAWSEFERFSPKTAGERVLCAFGAAGFEHIANVYRLPIDPVAHEQAKSMLLSAGWNGTSRLIVMNPAGLWETRQWPLENYLFVAKLMLEENETQFVLLGTNRITEKTQYIRKHLGRSVVDLVQHTTLGEALAILQFADGIVTEDSGLMHMAWASRIPMVALFGSTNHVWSAPTGDWVRCFHSGDLPCSACMQALCKYGDVHCLTRITPHMVHEAMKEMLAKPRGSVRTSPPIGVSRTS